jgi:hypothetical protein
MRQPQLISLPRSVMSSKHIIITPRAMYPPRGVERPVHLFREIVHLPGAGGCLVWPSLPSTRRVKSVMVVRSCSDVVYAYG